MSEWLVTSQYRLRTVAALSLQFPTRFTFLATIASHSAWRGNLLAFRLICCVFLLGPLQSPVAYIRSRACWVIEYFSDLEWTGPRNAALLHAILKGLINGLRDPALPVQAAAACSLRLLIQAEGAAELLKPMLPEIVGEYFRIMEEVENESVLSALQVGVCGCRICVIRVSGN